jgi:glycopeptide antibiotics resistance protein
VLTRGIEAEWLALVWLTPAALMVLLLLATSRGRRSVRSQTRVLLGLFAVGYLVAAVAITLWPFQADLSPERIVEEGNWVPFQGTLRFLLSDDPLQVRLGTRDFLANVVLFFPLGLLFGLLTRRLLGLAFVLVAIAAVAFGLELVQGVTITGRTLDVDDAIAGAIGALAGTVAAAALRPLTSR